MTLPAAPRRVIGLSQATLVTVGAMIGSGIFSTPTEVARMSLTPSRALLVWALAGAVSLLGALSMCELGAALPDTGGLYVYLRRAFGPACAFVFGWAMLVVLVPSAVGYFAQVTARHLATVLPLPESSLTLAVIALVGVVNVAGVIPAASLQSATAVLKYAGLMVVGACALAVAPAQTHVVIPARAAPSTLLAAMIPALWAYDGWIDVTSIAGELRAPEKNVPKALVAGTVGVVLIYLLMVVAYTRALGFSGVSVVEGGALGHAIGSRIGGSHGAAMVTALVAVSAFGGCVIGMLTGTRVVQAMGADGSFVRLLGRTNPQGAPDVAIAVTTLLAIGYVRLPSMGALAEVFVVGAWPFYALGALATVVLRAREPLLPRPFRTPWHPLPEAIFTLAATALVGSYALSDTRSFARSVVTILAGLPLYFIARRVTARRAASRGA